MLKTQAKIEAMEARKEALRTWFDDLCDLAEAGEIQSLTASELHELLNDRSSDPNLPGNPGSLVSSLAAKEVQLGERNLFIEKGAKTITVCRASTQVPKTAA